MSGGQQAQNTLHENAIGWFILLCVFAVIIWVFWYFFDNEVRSLVRWIRYAQMYLVSLFVDSEYQVFWDKRVWNYDTSLENVKNYDTNELTYRHLSYINALAMQPLKIPFVALMGLAAIWCMFKGPNTQYRQKMGLEGLIQRQSLIFPVIAPFMRFNPSKQPPRPPGSPVPAELPPFAEALGPEEWLAYNSVANKDGELDEDGVAKAFEKQLGARWKGPNNLEPYKQILLAAFCLKAARKRNESDEMLGRLARCWSLNSGLRLSRDGKLLREARKILRDKDMSGKTLAKVNQHAFEATALLRALAVAREEGGVMAPAQFVWLRAHDRTLWYPLNNLGRQSFHMEAYGAIAHYKSEKMTSRPIPVPKVKDAVQGIVEYMNSSLKRPIPQLDYTGSKKRAVKKAT